MKHNYEKWKLLLGWLIAILVVIIAGTYRTQAQVSTVTDRLTIREYMRFKGIQVNQLDTALTISQDRVPTSYALRNLLRNITVSNDSVYAVNGTGTYFLFMNTGGPGGATDTSNLSYRIDTLAADIAAINLTNYLLKSDTASMLSPYLRDGDTASMLAPYLRSAQAAATYVSLSGSYADPTWITSLAWSKISGEPSFLLISDTANMLTPYLRKGDTAAMLLPYILQSEVAATYAPLSSLSSYLLKSDTASMLLPYILESEVSSLYYTKTNLQTSGQAAVHWGNITNAPAFLTSYTETDPVWTTASANYYTKTNMQTSGQAQLHWGNVTNAPAFLTAEVDGSPTNEIQDFDNVLSQGGSLTTNRGIDLDTYTLTFTDGATNFLVINPVANTVATAAATSISFGSLAGAGSRIVTASAAGLLSATVTDNSTNWNLAYGWGNHASAGYATASNTMTFTNKTWNGVAIGMAYGGVPPGGTTSQVLKKNSNADYDLIWGDGATGGATTLDGLSDVVITTPGTGNLLRYDGANWVNWVPNYLTANQSITLSGDASGTGTTGIAVTNTGLRGVALPALGVSAGFLRYTGTGTNTWVFDTNTYLTAETGTVQTVSVVNANGFSGSVANASTTPAITLTTTITGVLKGNGTAISAATAGTDYSAGTSALATGILKSTTTTGALSIAVAGTDYVVPSGSISGSAGSVANSVTFNNLGTGDASGTTYNGSAARTISFNTLGANAAIQFQEDGANLGTSGTATVVNFTGTSVTASRATNTVTVAITDVGFANPMTTLGDIIYGGAAGAATRLAGNTTTTKQFLTSTGSAGLATAPVWGTIAASDIGSGAALTKVDDTNVTLTLGGTPATSLLAATSLTLGWTGQLAVGRGGTGASTLTGILVGNGTSAVTAITGTALQYLRRNSGNTAYEFGAIAGSDVTGAALTKVDDTNVTLTLGGTPATALLRAASITVGWTGQLAVGRGGTGASTLTGVVIGNGASAMTAVAGTGGQLLRRNAGNTAYEFFTPTYLTAESQNLDNVLSQGGQLTAQRDIDLDVYNLQFTDGVSNVFIINPSANAITTGTATTVNFPVLSGTGSRVVLASAAGQLSALANGTNTHVLTLVGGVPTWSAPSTGGTPGGSNTQVQFNNSGAFGGSSYFTFNSSTGLVSLTNSSGKFLNLQSGSTGAITLEDATLKIRTGTNATSKALYFENHLTNREVLTMYNTDEWSIHPLSTLSSGTVNFFTIYPQISQGTTAGFTAFKISPYLAVTGSGTKLLADIGTNTAADGGGTHTSAFAINSAGNTGLGTVTPAGKLHVVGTVAATQSATNLPTDAFHNGVMMHQDGYLVMRSGGGNAAYITVGANQDFMLGVSPTGDNRWSGSLRVTGLTVGGTTFQNTTGNDGVDVVMYDRFKWHSVNTSTEIGRVQAEGVYGPGTIWMSRGATFGTSTFSHPAASAVVDIQSTSRGFLPPRMTSAQRTAISSPATGLVVYQTDGTEGLYENTASGWRIVNASAGGSQSAIQFKDEGTNIGTSGGATSVNFTGSGVTASESAGAVTVTINGGSGSPAGSDTWVQYNNAGAFGAATEFSWDNTAKQLSLSSSGGGLVTAGGDVGVNYESNSIEFFVSNSNRFKYSDFTTDNSGVVRSMSLMSTYNHTGTAGFTTLWISPYLQATGSGTKLLLDIGTNSAAGGSGTHTSYFNINSAGYLTITGSGQISGSLQANAFTASSSLAITSFGAFGAVYNYGSIAIGSNSSADYNTKSYIQGVYSLNTGTQAANIMFQPTLTGSVSGTHPFSANVLVRTSTVNTGTFTNFANLYVEGAATGTATITNSYALWVDAGKVRLDGDLDLPGIASATTANVLYFNSTTGAVTYGTAPGGGGMADPGGNGYVVRTALNTTTNRTLTGTSNRLTVTNGDGSVGNPVFDVVSTSAATASRIMERDANANTLVNNIVTNLTSTATAAGTTTLTVSSSAVQVFTGTTTQTMVLPNATTLTVGHTYHVHNQSTGAITVQTNGGATLKVIPAESDAHFTATAVGTAAGTWEVGLANGYMSKGITMVAPTATENVSLFYTTKALTVVRIDDVTAGTSPSVTWNVRWASTRTGTPTDLLAANRATTSTTGATTSTFANATIPAGSWVWLITSATSGTVTDFNVTITYKE